MLAPSRGIHQGNVPRPPGAIAGGRGPRRGLGRGLRATVHPARPGGPWLGKGHRQRAGFRVAKVDPGFAPSQKRWQNMFVMKDPLGIQPVQYT